MVRRWLLLYLVTAKVSLPVGFEFYQPDPVIAAWKKTDEALKKQGVKKAARPAKPVPDPAYPSQLDILIKLLREFAFHHPTVRVKAVLADAFYGSAGWMHRVMPSGRGRQSSVSSRRRRRCGFASAP